MDNAGSRRISVDIGGVDMDTKGDVSHISDGLPGTSGDISMVAMDKHAMRGSPPPLCMGKCSILPFITS